MAGVVEVQDSQRLPPRLSRLLRYMKTVYLCVRLEVTRVTEVTMHQRK